MHLQTTRPTAKAPAQAFTGDVYPTPVYTGQEPSRINVALVRFTPGARTNWHRHAVGQTLHITDGIGLVGTRDGTVLRARAGDTVICPPDEDHSARRRGRHLHEPPRHVRSAPWRTGRHDLARARVGRRLREGRTSSSPYTRARYGRRGM